MNEEVILTKDGSHSLYSEKFDEPYHSRHGAIQESMHVFIEMGLKELMKSAGRIRIFEMGFGTGLNAWLTLVEIQKAKIPTQYVSIEAYPLETALIEKLNYETLVPSDDYHLQDLHAISAEAPTRFGDFFELKKHIGRLESFETASSSFDLVYFDAFAPSSQPELWTTDIFRKLFEMMSDGALLCTYCAKGQVRRNMQEAGFTVEKLPGPPGKREMLRAKK